MTRVYRLVSILLLASCSLVSALAAPAAAQQIDPKITGVQIGFEGTYKLGCWTPLTVELQGGSEVWTGRVVVAVPDTDGVTTRVVSDRPIGLDPEQTATARLLVRVGQAMSTLDVRFVSDDGRTRASRKFYVGPVGAPNSILGGMPAMNRIVLQFGPSLGLSELVQSIQPPDEQLHTRVAHLEDASQLPTRWLGYESVDTVVLTSSQPELYRPLLQSSARLDALQQWVEQGGELVIFCGAGATELLAAGGALQSLVPGNFQTMEQLTQAQPLATFSGSDKPISLDRRVALDVPSLTDVQGQILASAGRTATTVPLVIRARRGFGEITFVGLDFDRPPLSTWEGRTSFLRRVLQWQDRDESQRTGQYVSPDDLAGHLRNVLDRSFVGVQVIPFGLVAFLVGVYILLIGPGDYLLVKNVLRRTELTWITFPLMVLAVSVLAYLVANRLKGNQLQVNQLEIVDVDLTAAPQSAPLARGTIWSHFYTPQVNEFNLELQPNFLGGSSLDADEQAVAWLGLPGYALGGMQASGAQTSVFDSGYQFGTDLSTMQRLPVQVWSTKTLTGRWTAEVSAPLEVNLRRDGEELLRGEITNNSDVELVECQLLFGRWAYDLGRLPANASFEIDSSKQPRTVKTLLTSANAGDETITSQALVAEDGTVPFERAQWDMARLAKAMMFHEAIGGSNYTKRVHRYQQFVDLSKVLATKQEAVLLAKCESPGTDWIANDRPLASDRDRRWTYYRFLVPVDNQESRD